MALNVRENGAEQFKPFSDPSIGLLPVSHWALSGQCPEADLRVNFKHPLLAIGVDSVIDLLDLRGDAPSLYGQTSSRVPEVRGTGGVVILRREGCPARSGKHACATGLA